MGKPIKIVPRSQINDSLGRVRFHPITNAVYNFFLADNLNVRRYRRIYRHELGHLLALKTGAN